MDLSQAKQLEFGINNYAMIRYCIRSLKFIVIRFYSLVARINNWFILRANSVDVGKNLIINGPIRCDVKSSGRMSLAENVKINSGPIFNPIGRNQISNFRVGHNANLVIGDFVCMSSVTIVCSKEILIGDNVHIGGNTVIYDTDFHSVSKEHRANRKLDQINTVVKPILIEDGVFIGAHSTILKGSEIGKNSVVGAGSLVAGAIPANEIWAGNPARFIKSL